MRILMASALACVLTFCSNVCVDAEDAPATRKTASAFFPDRLAENARANASKYKWAAEVRDRIVRSAQPWLKMSEDQLWALMYGSTIERSWMVWSNGHCPACKEGVPMYNWQIDALGLPWKVRCPHCREVFPKNDFAAFYRSGLDVHGVFDPNRADRALLFNVDHPDPDDPLRTFGVDAGNGFVEGGNRWRFIGAYLVYGQWKQAVAGGITKLADAYTATGDPVYARRAGILLDRVADLYPTFDYSKQAYVYEKPGNRGYVSTWHDACEEVRLIALAYDQVFKGMRDDEALVEFLARKAKQYNLDNTKTSFDDIQKNIEDRILRDTLRNRPKIESNYPRTDVALAVIRTVLDWPENREEVNALLDGIISKATAVDGVTGEKGLAGYATIGPHALATVLGRFARLEPGFLAEIYMRHPRLHQTYRFHIDTWCLEKYYPLSGDTGHFAGRIEQYAGISFARPGSLEPSAFSFMWKLYKLSGDPAFVKILYRANDEKTDGLPYDLLAADPTGFQKSVAEVIEREGTMPKVGSVNKEEWHIAILRSGEGDYRRAMWIDYDAGGRHSHNDGMNLGLFAENLDLMPDDGYPPVQFGGWSGPKFTWYVMPASHNTVVVDGKRQPAAAGQTTFWADGERFRAIRVSAPALIGGRQFERTVAMIDISDRTFYLVDIFRVVGGKDHAKFFQSHFGQVEATGVTLMPQEPYGHGTLMRNFRGDANAKPGWSVDWKIEDRYNYLPAGTDVHVRYTEFTSGADASLAEGWIVAGIYNSNEEAWIPRLMVRRQSEAEPLASTFVAVIEPYSKESNVASIRRVSLTNINGETYPDSFVGLEVVLKDGSRDLILAADVENPLQQKPALSADSVMRWGRDEWNLNGELGMVRIDKSGNVRRVALCNSRSLASGSLQSAIKPLSPFVEITLNDQGRATVVSGTMEDVDVK